MDAITTARLAITTATDAMKQTLVIAAAILAIFATTSSEAGRVRGYVKKDGTYVAPHQRSNPNSTKTDNYGTKGNTNPYTGKEGTKCPYGSPC
jgi:hypothetical protein